MTQTQTIKSDNKLIHVAHIIDNYGRKKRLLLRKKPGCQLFIWHEEDAHSIEQETEASADNIETAICIANYTWNNNSFSTLNCGFRFTLPERDEHGTNALFHQMVASYSSANGIYYDEELGNNCIVQKASIEARRLWQQLKSQDRL